MQRRSLTCGGPTRIAKRSIRRSARTVRQNNNKVFPSCHLRSGRRRRHPRRSEFLLNQSLFRDQCSPPHHLREKLLPH